LEALSTKVDKNYAIFMQKSKKMTIFLNNSILAWRAVHSLKKSNNATEFICVE